MEKQEVTIPNYTFFGVKSLVVELHRFEDEDDPENEYIYNVHLSYLLDDGKDDGQDKVVTTITDFWLPCPACLAQDTFDRVSMLFDHICSIVTIWDIEGKEVGEIDMNDEKSIASFHLEAPEVDVFGLADMQANVPVIVH